jgi:hypothetical protein
MAGMTDEILRDTKEAAHNLTSLDIPGRAREWDPGQWQQIKILRNAMPSILRSIDRLAIQNDMIIKGQVGPGSKNPVGHRSRPTGAI